MEHGSPEKCQGGSAAAPPWAPAKHARKRYCCPSLAGRRWEVAWRTSHGKHARKGAVPRLTCAATQLYLTCEPGSHTQLLDRLVGGWLPPRCALFNNWNILRQVNANNPSLFSILPRFHNKQNVRCGINHLKREPNRWPRGERCPAHSSSAARKSLRHPGCRWASGLNPGDPWWLLEIGMHQWVVYWSFLGNLWNPCCSKPSTPVHTAASVKAGPLLTSNHAHRMVRVLYCLRAFPSSTSD